MTHQKVRSHTGAISSFFHVFGSDQIFFKALMISLILVKIVFSSCQLCDRAFRLEVFSVLFFHHWSWFWRPMDFSRNFLLLIKELFTEIYVFYEWFKMKIMTFVQFCPIFIFSTFSTFSFVLSYFHFCPIFNFVNMFKLLSCAVDLKTFWFLFTRLVTIFHTFEKWGKYFWWFSASCIDWNDLWIRHDSKSRKNF